MKKKVLFQEQQKQNQKWIWFLLSALSISFLILFVQEWFFNIPIGDSVLPWFVYLPVFILLAGLIFLQFKSK